MNRAALKPLLGSVLFALLGWRFCTSPGTPENLKPILGFIFFGFAGLGIYKGISIIIRRKEPPSSDQSPEH